MNKRGPELEIARQGPPAWTITMPAAWQLAADPTKTKYEVHLAGNTPEEIDQAYQVMRRTCGWSA